MESTLKIAEELRKIREELEKLNNLLSKTPIMRMAPMGPPPGVPIIVPKPTIRPKPPGHV